ncbi:MAG: bifunctional (p)ppGpp synthetase/guanosine-3',5'-bis(diphosphate) 3'-pyrophosphohydrolase, partial [Candidatus Lambdaproteobacteria bacterium]|nr:bifunctional (p)ppGpp synthetase/guanosine-3',5'-bis(diphosphate) 3'-pyrophosphohydrolase [Candidatus Lambdaproteobacteria bacterium]
MIRIDNLIAKVAGYLPPGVDLELVRKAYVYSATLHRDRFDPTGFPVLQHALEVGDILADMKVDVRCIAAGLLHDAVEDRLADPAELAKVAGEEVARLVVELSKLSRATFQGSEATRAQHMREMILATTRDLRVILILLADRLHSLRSPAQLPESARVPLARETLEIFGPIAHRLGIHFFKAEMEDRAFQLLEPERFAELQ